MLPTTFFRDKLRHMQDDCHYLGGQWLEDYNNEEEYKIVDWLIDEDEEDDDALDVKTRKGFWYKPYQMSSGDVVSWECTKDFLNTNRHVGFVLGKNYLPENKLEVKIIEFHKNIKTVIPPTSDNGKNQTGICVHYIEYNNLECIKQLIENNGYFLTENVEDWINEVKFIGNVRDLSLDENIISDKFCTLQGVL